MGQPSLSCHAWPSWRRSSCSAAWRTRRPSRYVVCDAHAAGRRKKKSAQDIAPLRLCGAWHASECWALFPPNLPRDTSNGCLSSWIRRAFSAFVLCFPRMFPFPPPRTNHRGLAHFSSQTFGVTVGLCARRDFQTTLNAGSARVIGEEDVSDALTSRFTSLTPSSHHDASLHNALMALTRST